jgi:hypothetical protein
MFIAAPNRKTRLISVSSCRELAKKPPDHSSENGTWDLVGSRMPPSPSLRLL